MPLRAKLNNITSPALTGWTNGTDNTIADFWNNFVEPRLPNSVIVTQWFQLLDDYVQEMDAVYAIRIFADRKNNDPLNLRRGFYNTTDQNYSFFYTDNYFTAYFAKMAIDGFVPTLQEFKDVMLTKDFPARFGPYCRVEKAKAAYSIDGSKGRNPGFTKTNYKIAHVINTGTDYEYGNSIQGISEICNKYAPRGNYNDWVLDASEGCHLRPLHYNNTDGQVFKEYLKAHFLRFVCPMNYFLVPQKKYQSFTSSIPKNDIGEHPDLQKYAIYRLYQRYGNLYIDYLNKIMLPKQMMFPITATNIQKLAVYGTTPININYSHTPTTTTRTTTPSLTTPNPFKAHLSTVTNKYGRPYSAKVIQTYCSSLNHPLFKNILTRHVLPSDIYLCTDITALFAVYQEVKQKHTADAQALADKRHGACTSALRQYAGYLRANGLATNDNGQIFN